MVDTSRPRRQLYSARHPEMIRYLTGLIHKGRVELHTEWARFSWRYRSEQVRSLHLCYGEAGPITERHFQQFSVGFTCFPRSLVEHFRVIERYAISQDEERCCSEFMCKNVVCFESSETSASPTCVPFFEPSAVGVVSASVCSCLAECPLEVGVALLTSSSSRVTAVRT